ncbi:sigma-54 dependent transcriptional regulator [Amaricoccus sp.]|uniref:sigma-54-dependent transcriptional regulator n=1 Tax=Amaricoccus sp. TaxID=1872485 RepID=UPI001B53CAE8|nr:sigma-54 dependent transcriptional regulator [Amaricoccus sp.]MBP7000846.1 sigma-54-dependent Fis family transcriptional regulator [Amaricoccus sp.]
MPDRVLLVEDTSSLSMVYEAVLKRAGYRVTCAASLAEARAICAEVRPRLVLLDLQLPDGDGLELLAELSHDAPESRVIVITANGSINRAVEAMRAGAFDFLVKPFDESRLIKAVENAIATLDPLLPDDHEQRETFEGFIGHSAPMQEIYRMVRAIGRSTATVFITGESGTGKEVCARAIHAMSTRARKPFVPLNCAAIPRDLLESEVFGHLKGAFTGALSDKPGAAAVADGGTLFLDEICEMDLSLQTKLLRFLQTSQIHPVGAARPVPVDVRIVCATNRDPAEEVRQGRFREDLYYRLHVVPIHMPPLRQRPEDIVEIARASLGDFAAEEGKSFVSLAPEVERLFAARAWPGNVRQLLNVIRNVVVLHDGPVVLPEMLPAEIALGAGPGAEDRAAPPPAPPPAALAALAPQQPVFGTRNHVAALVGTPLAEVERELIEATIEHCHGSIPRAARMLELSPSTIYRKLESWAAAGQRQAGE